MRKLIIFILLFLAILPFLFLIPLLFFKKQEGFIKKQRRGVIQSYSEMSSMNTIIEDGDSSVASNTDGIMHDTSDHFGPVENMMTDPNIQASSTSTSGSCPGSEFHGEAANARLVKTLMACAEAVQQNELNLADALLRDVKSILAVEQYTGITKRMGIYFAQALDRRINETVNIPGPVKYSLLQMHFYEICPYLKFAHVVANQAILEAVADFGNVHVIDFGLNQGVQWPAFLQALALRPGCPPAFRLTGIDPGRPDDNGVFDSIRRDLTKLARGTGVKFSFRGITLADVKGKILNTRRSDSEAVAVNSVFALHTMLSVPGAIEKVLNSIKQMEPTIVTIIEQEADHNGSIFVDRFKEAWGYYSTVFDSLGTCPNSRDTEMVELYLGRQIHNIVACEGDKRTERHETLGQWRARMNKIGFNLIQLSTNTYSQARMFLDLYGSRGEYSVEMNEGCIVLSWRGRALITISAWRKFDIRSVDEKKKEKEDSEVLAL